MRVSVSTISFGKKTYWAGSDSIWSTLLSFRSFRTCGRFFRSLASVNANRNAKSKGETQCYKKKTVRNKNKGHAIPLAALSTSAGVICPEALNQVRSVIFHPDRQKASRRWSVTGTPAIFRPSFNQPLSSLNLRKWPTFLYVFLQP